MRGTPSLYLHTSRRTAAWREGRREGSRSIWFLVCNWEWRGMHGDLRTDCQMRRNGGVLCQSGSWAGWTRQTDGGRVRVEGNTSLHPRSDDGYQSRLCVLKWIPRTTELNSPSDS